MDVSELDKGHGEWKRGFELQQVDTFMRHLNDTTYKPEPPSL